MSEKSQFAGAGRGRLAAEIAEIGGAEIRVSCTLSRIEQRRSGERAGLRYPSMRLWMPPLVSRWRANCLKPTDGQGRSKAEAKKALRTRVGDGERRTGLEDVMPLTAQPRSNAPLTPVPRQRMGDRSGTDHEAMSAVEIGKAARGNECGLVIISGVEGGVAGGIASVDLEKV